MFCCFPKTRVKNKFSQKKKIDIKQLEVLYFVNFRRDKVECILKMVVCSWYFYQQQTTLWANLFQKNEISPHQRVEITSDQSRENFRVFQNNNLHYLHNIIKVYVKLNITFYVKCIAKQSLLKLFKHSTVLLLKTLHFNSS